MSETQKGRRRGFISWFVEPYRQVKLGLIFLILNLIFSVLILSVFGFYFWDVYKALTVYFQLTPDQGAEILSKFKVPVIVACTLIALFIFTTILASVRYTHEIYGPLVSIHRYLDDMIARDVKAPLKLRDSDQLKELAEKLNQLSKQMYQGNEWSKVEQFIDSLADGHKPAPLELTGTAEFTGIVNRLNRLAEAGLKSS